MEILRGVTAGEQLKTDCRGFTGFVRCIETSFPKYFRRRVRFLADDGAVGRNGFVRRNVGKRRPGLPVFPSSWGA